MVVRKIVKKAIKKIQTRKEPEPIKTQRRRLERGFVKTKYNPDSRSYQPVKDKKGRLVSDNRRFIDNLVRGYDRPQNQPSWKIMKMQEAKWAQDKAPTKILPQFKPGKLGKTKADKLVPVDKLKLRKPGGFTTWAVGARKLTPRNMKDMGLKAKYGERSVLDVGVLRARTVPNIGWSSQQAGVGFPIPTRRDLAIGAGIFGGTMGAVGASVGEVRRTGNRKLKGSQKKDIATKKTKEAREENEFQEDVWGMMTAGIGPTTTIGGSTIVGDREDTK